MPGVARANRGIERECIGSRLRARQGVLGSPADADAGDRVGGHDSRVFPACLGWSGITGHARQVQLPRLAR